MRLYAHIFSYLSKCMAWWTSRSRTRFLKSFNENILDIFETDRKQIKKAAILMSEQIQRYISADVRASKLLSDETNDNVKYLIDLEESAQEQLRMRDVAQTALIENILHSKFERSTRDLERCLQNVVGNIYQRLRGEFIGAKTRNLLTQQASLDHIETSTAEHDSLLGKLITHSPHHASKILTFTVKTMTIRCQRHKLKNHSNRHPRQLLTLSDSNHGI